MHELENVWQTAIHSSLLHNMTSSQLLYFSCIFHVSIITNKMLKQKNHMHITAIQKTEYC
jgi:hypothetical protein